jgi:cold shock protein
MAMTGTVKFFNGERGYGFIKQSGQSRDFILKSTGAEKSSGFVLTRFVLYQP